MPGDRTTPPPQAANVISCGTTLSAPIYGMGCHLQEASVEGSAYGSPVSGTHPLLRVLHVPPETRPVGGRRLRVHAVTVVALSELHGHVA